MFENEAQKEHYFSYASHSFTTDPVNLWKSSDDWEFAITLSEEKKVEKRKAYTYFDLLGDFGGFNDAIYFLLSIPLGMYSSTMFSRHISSLFKVYNKKEHLQRSILKDSLHGNLRVTEKEAIMDLIIDRAKNLV